MVGKKWPDREEERIVKIESEAKLCE